MKTSFSTIFLLVLLVCCLHPTVQAVGLSNRLRFVDILNQQHGLPAGNKDTANHEDVQSMLLEQRLDHFETSTHKFNQRYFYSDRHVDATQPQQYAFLCVGGEGPSLTPRVLVDSVHCSGDMLELARQLHQKQGASVHLFALEHRYYGESYPDFVDKNNQQESPVTNENLVYLSSRQALADLAHFVLQMMEVGPLNRSSSRNITDDYLTATTPLPSNTLWVTFGGSYPGMLAGWARLKYPHLIHAAVSNSAPIQAQLDMTEYNNRVGWDLQYSKIGGSKACLQVFQEGHDQLVDMVKNPEFRLSVAKAFNFCKQSSLDYLENVQGWLGDGVIQVPAQSNDPSCDRTEFCNVEKICSYVTNKRQLTDKASWQILADLANEKYHTDQQCLDVDWNSTLDYIKDPQQGQQGGLRSWEWQTCTEFGFYQTCEIGSNCPYAKGYHVLQEDLHICEYAFGVSAQEVQESVQQTKEYYGNKLLKGGSHIVSVNGNVDPWATLARDNDAPNSDDPLLPTLMVEGASHHFWTHPVQDTDSPFVTRARQFIYDTVTKWLDLEMEVTNQMELKDTDVGKEAWY